VSQLRELRVQLCVQRVPLIVKGALERRLGGGGLFVNLRAGKRFRLGGWMDG
jgi:hypothetical protein